MRRLVETLFVVATCWLLVACTSTPTKVHKDLARTFVVMQDEGKLPGLPPGADAEIHMEPIERFQHIAYPYSRDIFVMLADKPDCYTYHFVKDAKDSKWQLTKAWITTQNGERSELKVQ